MAADPVDIADCACKAEENRLVAANTNWINKRFRTRYKFDTSDELSKLRYHTIVFISGIVN